MVAWIAMLGRVVAILPLVVGFAGCSNGPPDLTGGVTFTLDIPNATLDPKGYTEVEVTMHAASGDLVRTAPIGGSNAFDLGDLPALTGVWVEAALRNGNGAAVGYGRTAAAVDFTAGLTVTVPIRRPIVYVAGLVSMDQDGNPGTANDIVWSATAATFSDLTSGAPADGSAKIGSHVALMVSAGPALFMIEQGVTSTPGAPTNDPATKLTGPATIKPISTGDHTITAALAASLDGGVRDGAGSDDGKWLVIGTTLHLYLVDTTAGTASSVADGDFARVAMVNHGDETASALALQDRGTPCNASAKLITVAFSGTGEVSPVVTAGTGGFADVASDANRAFAVDACKGQLVEITGTTIKMIHDGLGKPTALAVSNGHAYIGVETAAPTGLALVVASLVGTDMPRTLWTEPSLQVATATDYPGVQREMTATSAAFDHLEVGAGDDYVAMTSLAHFNAQRENDLTFPALDLDTEELRVFDTSSGGVLQRYRSWCDGTIQLVFASDVANWACATTTGQTAPSPSNEHHLDSMTFLFGRK